MKRINEKMKWYWPEIHRYCGCCNLRTGIYIRTVISMITNLTSLSSNCVVLYYMIYTSQHFTKNNKEIDMFDSLLEIPDLSGLQKHKMILTFKILLGYYVAWIIMKGVYTVLLIIVIYGVYKRKARILKVFLYIVVPYWIFDVIVSSLGAIVSNFWLKFVLVIALLSEGYNLLAINTEYKIIKGKSMVSYDSSSADIETMTVCENQAATPGTSINNNYQVHNQQLHCRTCTCQSQCTIQPVNSNETPSTSASENITSLEKERPESLNFKDTAIIFDQSQMIDSDTPVLLTECRNRALRRSIVHEKDHVNDKKMEDEPVIYDDSQLNIGTSPIIENRPFINEDSI